MHLLLIFRVGDIDWVLSPIVILWNLRQPLLQMVGSYCQTGHWIISLCCTLCRGFNKHWRPMKHVGFLAHRGRLLFTEKEATSLNNGLNKKYIIKSEWKRSNYDICFPKGPLVLPYALVMWTLYFSHFFTSFFIGLRRICLRAKVRNLVFIICSLPVGIDCVTGKLKATFSWMKSMLFCSQI